MEEVCSGGGGGLVNSGQWEKPREERCSNENGIKRFAVVERRALIGPLTLVPQGTTNGPHNLQGGCHLVATISFLPAFPPQNSELNSTQSLALQIDFGLSSI